MEKRYCKDCLSEVRYSPITNSLLISSLPVWYCDKCKIFFYRKVNTLTKEEIINILRTKLIDKILNEIV